MRHKDILDRPIGPNEAYQIELAGRAAVRALQELGKAVEAAGRAAGKAHREALRRRDAKP